MTKKGILEEIFSKARFSDNPFSYRIFFRDLDTIKELNLPDFLEESNDFEKIPVNRIVMIKKNNTILFQKSKT
jgi:uncharacterized protein (UPF0248 family)